MIFINWVYRNIWFNKPFWFVLSVTTIISAYLFLPQLPKGSFYKLTAISFCSLWRLAYLQSKGSWSLAYFVMWLISFNNLLDELFFDPKEQEYNEVFAALLIVVITWRYKNKWIR